MLHHLNHQWSSRSIQQEIMDSEQIDLHRLNHTFDHLKIINNYLSGIRKLLLNTILKDVSQTGQKRFTVLELGCGGGDIAKWLSRTCLKYNLECIITCIDNNENAIAYAEKECSGYENINIKENDAFRALEEFKTDYIFANHFLHHLPDFRIGHLLSLMANCAGKGFLINDLCRSPVSLIAFSIIGILFRKSYAAADGKLSIRKGFTEKELNTLSSFLKFRGVVTVRRNLLGHLSLWFRSTSSEE